MKKIALLLIPILFILPIQSRAQKEKKSKTDTVKTGWTLGGVPAIAYDRDVGFLYGVILNLYDFGDGSRYPLYDHSIYLEWSRTTKGTGKNIFVYDSDKLIPGIRTAAEASYLTEQTLDFYGFNGYKSIYNHAYENENDPAYISRVFYRLDRKLLRLRADFSGNLKTDKLKWFGGIEFYNNRIDTVDIDKLNKGKSDEDKLPYVNGGLFGQYAYQWNIIPATEIKGGNHTVIKAGLIYDTRDNEPNPMRGIWTEAQFILAPSFLSDKDLTYTRLILTHRQYFTIIPRDLNLAYRLSYQVKLSGEMPFYMLPFVYNSPPNYTRDGLGGFKTMRGILRNRVVGEDLLFGNLELRWKFLHTRILKQNFYIALSTFLDGGMVTREYKINTSDVPSEYLYLFQGEEEKLHLGTGAGLHFVLNENFIVAVDYGFALDPDNDGSSALYIGLDFLF